MQLTAVFMRQLKYNLFDMGAAMFEDGFMVFSMMVFFFLFLMPVVKLIAISIFWFSKVKLSNLERCNEIVKAIGKWSMLDVFTFAFILF